MVQKSLFGWLIATCLAGCAAQVGAEPKGNLDIETDDALVAASEGRADSASRPTLLGELADDDSMIGSFGRGARYLAFSFDANEGDEIVLRATAESPASLDPVLILYNATSGGRPSGASIAFNDDQSTRNTNSKLEYTAEETRKFVAVVRRYDRGSSGSVSVSLQITGHSRGCGTRGAGPCNALEFCDFAMDAACGATDAGGTCRRIPDACTEDVNPVCGCDGNTYTNACEAAASSVSVESDGECRTGHACPATGVPCTPLCPGSGRLNGHACRTGNFDATTCTCKPIDNCSVTGCGEGRRCIGCWGHLACIPEGARC